MIRLTRTWSARATLEGLVLCAGFLTAAGLVLGAASASAQYRLEPPATPPSEADADRARALFMEGAAHVEAGRWADALQRFESSYETGGVPAALFNAATTLRSMGRHRDSRDAFEQLLESPDLDPESRVDAQARRDEEAARVAQVTLTGLEQAPDATLLLDGLRLEVETWDPVRVEADPGRHALRVEREGFESWREELTLADGERRRVEVALAAIEAPAPIIVAVDGEEFYESPVFWVIVAVLVAGGAALTGFLVYDGAQLSPNPDFTDAVIEL